MTNERTIDENWKAAFWKQNEEAANRLLGPKPVIRKLSAWPPCRYQAWPGPVEAQTNAKLRVLTPGYRLQYSNHPDFRDYAGSDARYVRAVADTETPDDRIKRDWGGE